MPLQVPEPQILCEILNVCSFKMLNSGVICYTTIDISFKLWLLHITAHEMVPTVFTQPWYVEKKTVRPILITKSLSRKKVTVLVNMCINYKMHPKWKCSNCLFLPQKLFLPVCPTRGNRLPVGQAKNSGLILILLFPHFGHPGLRQIPLLRPIWTWTTSHHLLTTTWSLDNYSSLLTGLLAFTLPLCRLHATQQLVVLPRCKPSLVSAVLKPCRGFPLHAE